MGLAHWNRLGERMRFPAHRGPVDLGCFFNPAHFITHTSPAWSLVCVRISVTLFLRALNLVQMSETAETPKWTHHEEELPLTLAPLGAACILAVYEPGLQKPPFRRKCAERIFKSQMVSEEELAACPSFSEPVISTPSILPGHLICWAENICFPNFLVGLISQNIRKPRRA